MWDQQICTPMSPQAETGSPTKMKSNTHLFAPDAFLLKLMTAVLFFSFPSAH